MPRAHVTVSKLADEAGIDAEEALLRLWDKEVAVELPTDLIPRRQLSAARAAVKLPNGRDIRAVAHLAHSAGLSVEESVDRLRTAGVLLVGDYVQRGAVSKARKVLGISATSLFEPEDLDVVQSDDAAVDEPFVLPLIGRRESVQYLTATDVERIHWELVADFANSPDPLSPPGVRDSARLEGAVHRPQTGLGDELKYPTVALAGAAFFHSLVLDHPFHNGNKRTGLVATLVFLERNNYMLEVEDSELFRMVLRIAKHDLCNHFTGPYGADREVEIIAQWLCDHTRLTHNEERCLKFHELRGILTSYGCDVQVRPGGRVQIVRKVARSGVLLRTRTLRSNNWYGTDGRDVAINTIHKIRRELELDEEHGVDSLLFYEARPGVSDFIARYRQTLNRLARF